MKKLVILCVFLSLLVGCAHSQITPDYCRERAIDTPEEPCVPYYCYGKAECSIEALFDAALLGWILSAPIP